MLRAPLFRVGLLLALLAGLMAPASLAQELPFRHFTTQNEINPLPSPAVTDVYQDRQGYVWMAIYGTGLVRYDGQQMDVFTPADGLLDTQIFGLVEDGAGRLWAVASDRALMVSTKPLASYRPGERVQFSDTLGAVPLYQERAMLPINVLVADRDGDIWFGTDHDGIVRYHMEAGGTVRADTLGTAPAPGAPNARVSALGTRRDGTVWAGLFDGRLLVLGADDASVLRTTEAAAGPVLRTIAAADAPCPQVNVFYESAAGVLWGGCSGHPLWKLTGTGAAPRFETVGAAPPGTLTALLEVAPDVLWAGGLQTGIVEVDASGNVPPHPYTRTSGLLDINLWALLRDREGNVWVAQNSGLSRLPLNHTAFRYYTGDSHAGEVPVLPAVDALALLPDFSFGAAGRDLPPLLVVGTSGGVAFIRPDGQAAHVTTEQGLRNNVALSLCTDGAQRLWVGTRPGVSVIGPAAALPPGGSPARPITLFGVPLYLKSFSPTAPNTCYAFPLAADSAGTQPPGEMVVFATGGGIYALVEGHWFLFDKGAGLPVGDFWAVARDDEGYLYVGAKTSGGIYRSLRPFTRAALAAWSGAPLPKGGASFTSIAAPVFELLTDADGAPLVAENVSAFAWDGGTLWANTDAGLVALEGTPRRRTPLDSTQHTGDNRQVVARSPTTGTLWIGGTEGMVEVDPARRTVLRHITREDGLLGNETWGPAAIVAGADGTIYHGSARGVTVYHPDRDAANAVPPLVAFTAVHFSQGQRGNNELSVRYAALSFASEKRVRYRTRLVGYDAGWSAPTSETSLRYTNLPAFFVPRRYTFEVVAANNAGVWTAPPLRYSFRVQPPLWLRWWSFLIYAVLLAGGVFAVDRVQRRRLLRIERERAQARELEQAREIERAYHELETTHTRLKSTQEQLVHQEKLASLGALTAGIAHEIKNPLNFVNNFAQLTGELVQELRGEAAARPDLRVADVEDLLGDIELNTTKIAEHGRRADGIIRGMLAHARGTTGRREATDLNALADECATLAYHGARAQQPDAQVQLEKDFDPALGRVEVLPQEISRVLLNLLSNAFYAVAERQAEANGQMGAYRPTVRVSTRRHEGGVEVRVEDNGTGIPENVRRRIFEPFFTTKPTGEGTGLGLSLSHEIALAHGGTLTAHARAGGGTAFVLSLPATPHPEHEVSP